MANFASFFTATTYGVASVLDNKNGGWQLNPGAGVPSYDAYPKSNIVLHVVSPAQTFATTTNAQVTINSIIEILPTGSQAKSIKMATDSTFAQLVTNGA